MVAPQQRFWYFFPEPHGHGPFRPTRSIPLSAPRAHLDFLHPARDLWRLRLGSVRLSQLERHVLGRDRGADVVSELIPSIYLDFVRGGHADPLVPVFRHNQMDLRGLGAFRAASYHSSATTRQPARMHSTTRRCVSQLRAAW